MAHPAIPAEEYGAFLAREYLSDFIQRGGSAVKFAVHREPGDAEALGRSLEASAGERGYVFAGVDAAATKISQIQQLFFAVSRQMPWLELSKEVVRTLLGGEYRLPEDGLLTLGSIAAANEVDESFVRRRLQVDLTDKVMHNYGLARDFRVAMASVCRNQLETGALAQQGLQSMLDWLKGELKFISAVKDEQIYQRIARHNARQMLISGARWCVQAGRQGLVVILDLEQLAVPGRGAAAENTFYYTPAAVMDAYEVLRQFIDGTDEMENLFVLVLTPAALLDEWSNRGFDRYPALKKRLSEDVRDRERANPFSPMVRIGSGEW